MTRTRKAYWLAVGALALLLGPGPADVQKKTLVRWPGLAIFLLTLSFNLAGDGLRDLLDPRDY